MSPPRGDKTALVSTEAQQAVSRATLAEQDAPDIHSPHSATSQSAPLPGLVSVNCIQRRPADRRLCRSQLGRRNGGNIQLHFFFPLHKPLESVYLSVGTHPYQQPCSHAPRAEECRRGEKGGKRQEREKRTLWKVLIRTREHTWLLHRLMFALLEHIRVWEEEEGCGL